jgi:SAM-dependent methyltransferase
MEEGMKRFSTEDIVAWFNPDRPPYLSIDGAMQAFHTYGSRARFLKTLPIGTAVLDAGAGDGNLQVFREWLDPKRPDLKMYAWANIKGQNFHKYDGYEVGSWPSELPNFSGVKFGAVFAANFIEHIDKPQLFVEMCARRLSQNGSIYLEWPHPSSVDLPLTSDLKAAGVKVMTGNYYCDKTHKKEVPSFDLISQTLKSNGFEIRETGIASVPFVDQELAIHSANGADITSATLAYWSHTGWCQYLIANR